MHEDVLICCHIKYFGGEIQIIYTQLIDKYLEFWGPTCCKLVIGILHIMFMPQAKKVKSAQAKQVMQTYLALTS